MNSNRRTRLNRLEENQDRKRTRAYRRYFLHRDSTPSCSKNSKTWQELGHQFIKTSNKEEKETPSSYSNKKQSSKEWTHITRLIDWLTWILDCPTDWLIDWLININTWLANWLIDWLIDWSSTYLVGSDELNNFLLLKRAERLQSNSETCSITLWLGGHGISGRCGRTDVRDTARQNYIHLTKSFHRGGRHCIVP